MEHLQHTQFYYVPFRYENDAPSEALLKHVRPRAHRSIELDEVKPGQIIMANYNLEDPEERGHWFDCKASAVLYSTLDGTPSSSYLVKYG